MALSASSGKMIREGDDAADPEGSMGLLTLERTVIIHGAEAPRSSSSTLRWRALWALAAASAAGLLLFAFCASPPVGSVVAAEPVVRPVAVDRSDIFESDLLIHKQGHKSARTVWTHVDRQEVVPAANTCPGAVHIAGLGDAALVSARRLGKWTAGPARQIEVKGETLVAHLNGRAYFGEKCNEGVYDPNAYQTLPLLGNTLTYTVDVSGAGCGCDAKIYLTSMKQNADPSKCGDYYCDANSACGVQCTELDIQEANMFAWKSALHTSDDGRGHGFGYGADADLLQSGSWEDGKYGPGAECIDTRKPFQVAVSFPVTANNTLYGMQVVLTQEGSMCPLKGEVNNYHFNGRDGMPEVTRALAEGMTPVVSYWTSTGMGWLDAKAEGPKGGVCNSDVPSECSASVRVYGFSLERGIVSVPAPAAASLYRMPRRITPLPPSTADRSAAVDAEWAPYPGKDTFAFHDVHQMNSADLDACKRYAREHDLAVFVVRRGTAYFRAHSGPACRARLEDSSEATTYILRSNLEPVFGPAAGVSKMATTEKDQESMRNRVGRATIHPNWFEASDADGGEYYYNKGTGQTVRFNI
jgi:hypothetical protein